jgi:integrase
VVDLLTPTAIVPVEYAVAVDRYLAEAELGSASKRVYRISLAAWAWPLVGQMPPTGTSRRRAAPPVVPLALLDDDAAGQRIARAVAHRIRHAELRTVNRELSALRSAVGYWQRRQWISSDPTSRLPKPTVSQPGARPLPLPPLTEQQLASLFGRPAGLREQAFWHLLADSGASADDVLALDADQVDMRGRRARPRPGARARGGTIEWAAGTHELLGWMLAGRRCGPLFLTDRRASAGTPRADVCPLSGRGRMSYRRAAEIFTGHTRPLDPEGHGWTLHQLRRPTAAS